MKKVVVSIFVVGALAIGLGWKSLHWHLLSRQSDFELALQRSSRSLLDLSEFGNFSWDELAFWGPYGSICELEINGFEKGDRSCWQSTDDGECYLLFLYKNKLAGQVAVNRKEADFAQSKIEWRVPRQRAKFKFASSMDWPKLEMNP